MALANDDDLTIDTNADDTGDRGDNLDQDTEDDLELADADAPAKKADDKGTVADKADKTEDKGIPKARFDEAVQKERTAREATEKRLQEAEAKLKAQASGLDAEKVEAEIAGLEADVDQALADGDKAKVAALRKEIRGKMMDMANAAATQQAAYATAVAVERVRYDAAVGVLEAAHPKMNPDSDEYDKDLTGELIELKTAYEATGMGSTDALKKAAKYVFATAPAEVKKEDTKGEPTEEEKKAAAEAEVKRKEAAIRRGAELKGKQPSAEKGKQPVKDSDGSELNVGKMNDKDFDKLTKNKDELARARGDIL